MVREIFQAHPRRESASSKIRKPAQRLLLKLRVIIHVRLRELVTKSLKTMKWAPS